MGLARLLFNKSSSMRGDLAARRRASFSYNGFTLVRGLLPRHEATEAARVLRAEVGEARIGASICDATTRLKSASSYLEDTRVLEVVRQALDTAQPRFLQVCDVQTDHNRENWHRDGACRTFGKGDWDERADPYRIAKIILYLDIKRAGLAVVPGSHRMKTSLGQVEDRLAKFDHIKPDDAALRPLFVLKPQKPVFVEMAPGDALLFDERLSHCGRRLNADGAEFSSAFAFPKSTLAYVYGADNRHSWRFHSYFRYHRKELKFRDLADAQVESLQRAALLPSFYGQNLFEAHPEEQENITGK